MLSRRYENDNKPLLKLNALQLRMKQQVEQKVKDGSYEFEEVPCPVCDGKSFESLAEKDRYGLYMPVVICRDCGLIQTNPRMNQNAYNEFYNDEYRPLYVGKENPTGEFFRGQYNKGRRIFEYLQANGLLKTYEDIFVLEIGCGAGGILHYFREQGCRVMGVDLGESYIEYGKCQYDLDLSFGTINTLDLNEAPNLIIYSHVLEHILTLNDELQNVFNILSDDGLLYIEVPGVKNLMNSYALDFLRLLQNAHTYHFTLKSLNNMVKRNGFELLAGNEVVCSAFGKVQNEDSSMGVENDYSDVMKYLQRIELVRSLCPIPPYKVKHLPKYIAIRTLKAIGLFEPVRNLYHKIKTS